MKEPNLFEDVPDKQLEDYIRRCTGNRPGIQGLIMELQVQQFKEEIERRNPKLDKLWSKWMEKRNG